MTDMKTIFTVDVKNPAHKGYLSVAVLLGAGLSLGVNPNLAKVADKFGVLPLAYLTWSMSGATLLLIMVSRIRGQSATVTPGSVEYFIIAGFLSAAGSNLIFFNAIPHLGVSFIAVMFSLPPLMTYVSALMLKIERCCWWRTSGVLLALAGTIILAFCRGAAPGTEHF